MYGKLKSRGTMAMCLKCSAMRSCHWIRQKKRNEPGITQIWTPELTHCARPSCSAKAIKCRALPPPFGKPGSGFHARLALRCVTRALQVNWQDPQVQARGRARKRSRENYHGMKIHLKWAEENITWFETVKTAKCPSPCPLK